MDAVTVAGMGDSVVMCAGQPFRDDWRARSLGTCSPCQGPGARHIYGPPPFGRQLPLTKAAKAEWRLPRSLSRRPFAATGTSYFPETRPSLGLPRSPPVLCFPLMLTLHTADTAEITSRGTSAFYSATITIGLSRQLLLVFDIYTSPHPTSPAVKMRDIERHSCSNLRLSCMSTVSYPCCGGHSSSAFPLLLRPDDKSLLAQPMFMLNGRE